LYQNTIKMNVSKLLADLTERTNEHLAYVEGLLELPMERLQQRDDPARWNTLENIEHLNLYSDFYLPEIDQKIRESNTEPAETFKSGWLGTYFVNAMIPGPDSKKMKTFKDKDTMNFDLDKECIRRFAGQLRTTLTLLDKASTVNLNKVKTGITLTSLIKIKLGDIFQVVIYHNDRHMVQIKKIIG